MIEIVDEPVRRFDSNHELAKRIERNASALSARSRAAIALNLYHLPAGEGLRVKDLAAAIGLSAGRTSDLVHELHERRLVEWERAGHGRAYRLTERGRRYVDLMASP